MSVLSTSAIFRGKVVLYVGGMKQDSMLWGCAISNVCQILGVLSMSVFCGRSV